MVLCRHFEHVPLFISQKAECLLQSQASHRSEGPPFAGFLVNPTLHSWQNWPVYAGGQLQYSTLRAGVSPEGLLTWYELYCIFTLERPENSPGF